MSFCWGVWVWVILSAVWVALQIETPHIFCQIDYRRWHWLYPESVDDRYIHRLKSTFKVFLVELGRIVVWLFDCIRGRIFVLKAEHFRYCVETFTQAEVTYWVWLLTLIQRALGDIVVELWRSGRLLLKEGLIFWLYWLVDAWEKDLSQGYCGQISFAWCAVFVT